MDKNHPAWKLAEAAQASVEGNIEFFDQFMETEKPTAKTIAQAYALGLQRHPFAANSAHRMTLEARLQVALVKEHVAAQERMGRTINRLTFVLVILTLVLVVFSALDIWQKLHPPPIPTAVAAADGPG